MGDAPIKTRPVKFMRLIAETWVACQPDALVSSYCELLWAYSACDMDPTLLMSVHESVSTVFTES